MFERSTASPDGIPFLGQLAETLRKREQAWKDRQQFSRFDELAEDSSLRSNYILSSSAGRRRQAFNLHKRGAVLGDQMFARSVGGGSIAIPSSPIAADHCESNQSLDLQFSSLAARNLFMKAVTASTSNVSQIRDFDPRLTIVETASALGCKSTGAHQSPIHLDPMEAVYDPQLADNPLEDHYQLTADFELINTGYVLQLSLRPRHQLTSALSEMNLHDGKSSFSASSSQIRASRADSKMSKGSILTGGPLEAGSEYQLIDIMFHWGKEETRGSEHSVNYKSYPMEVQLVHWNCTRYSSYDEALGKENGIVVCALFVQIGNDHPTIGAIIDHLEDISFAGSCKRISSEHKFTLNPSSLLPDPSLRDYWVYSGSLTIPPCHENVIWILYRYPLTISYNQRERFITGLRTVSKGEVRAGGINEDRMEDNFRPNQPLNNRTITSSFKP